MEDRAHDEDGHLFAQDRIIGAVVQRIGAATGCDPLGVHQVCRIEVEGGWGNVGKDLFGLENGCRNLNAGDENGLGDIKPAGVRGEEDIHGAATGSHGGGDDNAGRRRGRIPHATGGGGNGE